MTYIAPAKLASLPVNVDESITDNEVLLAVLPYRSLLIHMAPPWSFILFWKFDS